MARISSASLLFAVLFVTDSRSATHSEPIDTPTSGYSRTSVGDTAYLRCRLPDSGQHEVYWTQHQADNVILRHNRYESAEEGRFQAVCPLSSDECLLMIKKAEEEDSGLYQCVAESMPPIRGSVYLTVGEPVARILDDPYDVHWIGSAFNLTCVIRPRPWKLHHVLWMHDGEPITSYEDARVTITTEADVQLAVTTSHLQIQDAQSMDSGTYTCKPMTGISDSVERNVLAVHDVYHRLASGSQRVLAVAQSADLLVLAVAGAAVSNLCC